MTNLLTADKIKRTIDSIVNAVYILRARRSLRAESKRLSDRRRAIIKARKRRQK